METKNNKLPIIVIVCLAVVVAITLSVFLLRGCGEENNESNTDVSVNTEISETVSNTDISTEISADEVSAEESTPEESLPVDHTHEYAGAWSSNETDHWHECKCGDKSDIANHTFGEWETTKEATEDATGSKKHTCSVCGYEETATVPMLSHTHSYSKESSSNETDHWYECACGDKLGVTSHTYGDWTVTKESTEETEGSKYHTCSGCGYKETVIIPVLSHTHKYGNWKSNATSHWKECSCGDKSEMSAHGYGAWVTIKDATCTETGTKKHTCTNCGHSETTIIVVIAHSYGDWKSNATSHWKECSCGDKSEMSAHRYGDWVTTKDATCTETGTKKHTCTACRCSETATIPMASHDYVSVITPPTSSEQGYTTHTCDKCGNSYIDSFVGPVKLSEGLEYKINRDGKTCEIIGVGTCTDENIVIPDEIDGYKVIYIGAGAFTSNTDIKSVIIPDSVIHIGRGAFQICVNLANVTIGNGVTRIAARTFYKCESLKSVIIPDNVTYIGKGAFEKCINLINVTTGNGVTMIDDDAFLDCTNLTSVDMGNNVNHIGNAFFGCDNLTKLNIPNGVAYIGAYLYRHEYLQCNVYDNARYLGNGENPYFVLVGVTDSSITGCEIHPDTKFINSYAFCNCKNLTSIVIPEGVISIGDSAFQSCGALSTVTVPNGITYMGRDVFGYCTSLRYTTYDNANYLGNTENPYIALINTKSRSITSCTIHPDTRVMDGYAFTVCKSLTSIVIPDGVTSIGYRAFYENVNLKSVTIGNGVKFIGREAFWSCKNLTNVTLGNSVTSIGADAFRGCSNLSSITFPDSVTCIDDNAFAGCAYLAKISFGNGLRYIGYEAFSGCYAITTITLPDSVAYIGERAFCFCSNLKTVTVSNGVEYIGVQAFAECSVSDFYYKGTEEEWKEVYISNISELGVSNKKIRFNS